MKDTDKYVYFEELSKYDDVIHLYTKKPFNLDMDNLEGEFKKLEEMAGYKFDKLYISNQTHSTNIECVDKESKSLLNDVDGFVTNIRGVALLTKSADCQSVLLYDPVSKVIGNIHSGWKGTLNKIIDNAINIMITEYSCNPKDIKAFICPSILKCCFEVDEDLVEAFKKVFDNIDDLIILGDIKDGKQKYFLDTVTINKREMLKLGMIEENIYLSNICTMCNNDKYNSYRGDKTPSRNVALIALKK